MTREIPTAHIILLFLSNQPTLKQQVKQYWLMEIRFYVMCIVPSVLWCWWVGGRKGIWSVKKLEWCGAGVVICLGHTHTHTHNRFTALWNLSGKTWVSRYQKKHSPTTLICHLSYLICLGHDADLHMSQLIPLPLTVSCSMNPDWFWFYLCGSGSPG